MSSEKYIPNRIQLMKHKYVANISPVDFKLGWKRQQIVIKSYGYIKILSNWH